MTKDATVLKPDRKSLPFNSRKVRQILVPTDFSPAAHRAVCYAGPMAKRLKAAIVLLHVVPPFTYQADYGYGPVLRKVPNAEKILLATRQLKAIARPVGKLYGRSTCMIRSGTAAEEIVRAAHDLKSDLIVMGEGSLGDEGSERTTAERTLHDAPCPVLIVRRRGAELLKPERTDHENQADIKNGLRVARDGAQRGKAAGA